MHKERATNYVIALMFNKPIGLVRKWSEIRIGLMVA